MEPDSQALAPFDTTACDEERTKRTKAAELGRYEPVEELARAALSALKDGDLDHVSHVLELLARNPSGEGNE